MPIISATSKVLKSSNVDVGSRHPKLQHRFMVDLPPLTQEQINTTRGGGGLDPMTFQRKAPPELKLPPEMKPLKMQRKQT